MYHSIIPGNYRAIAAFRWLFAINPETHVTGGRGGLENSTGASASSTRATLADILNATPPLSLHEMRDTTLITPRFVHGSVHGSLEPMSDHVIATHYRDERALLWRSNGRSIQGRLRRNTITIVPAGAEGRCDCDGAIETSQVILSSDRFYANAEALGVRQNVAPLMRVGFGDPVAASLMEFLGEAASAPDFSARLFIEQCLDLLCTQILRSHSNISSLPERRKRGLADWQVRKVTSYMIEHLDQPIGLDVLAAEIGLSRFHFCSAFRHAMGSTPHEFLGKLRIDRAAALLGDGKLSVSEIALEVGYGTPSSFAAKFRRQFGMTPSEYRQLHTPAAV
jgi:AraC family transcriptional regulator